MNKKIEKKNIIRFRVPIDLSECSNRERKSIIYFSILKSVTKSDRIKKYTYQSLRERLNNFVGLNTVKRIINECLENEFIEKNEKNELIIKSWKKIVQELKNKSKNRKNIKFINIDIKKEDLKENNLFNTIKERIYKFLINKEIKHQKRIINKKLKNFVIKNDYLLSNNVDKDDFIRFFRGDGVRQPNMERQPGDKHADFYSTRIALKNICEEHSKVSDCSVKYVKDLKLDKSRLKTFKDILWLKSKDDILLNDYIYYNYKYTPKMDIYLVWLTAKSINKRLQISERQSNEILNKFGFKTQSFLLTPQEAEIGISNKQLRENNWYMFKGKGCLMKARLF